MDLRWIKNQKQENKERKAIFLFISDFQNVSQNSEVYVPEKCHLPQK